MKPTSLLLGLGLLLPLTAFGNGAIVYASRPLRMSYTQPAAPKDFYINIGARDGVKPGDRLGVQRNIGVPDGYSDSSVHVVSVALGSLQIIAVGESASIAREEAPLAAPNLPSLQYPGFMVGDEVLTKTDLPLGSAFP